MPRWMAILFLSANVCGVALAGSGKPAADDLTPVVVIQQVSVCGKLVESQWLDNPQQYHSTFEALFQGLISDSRPQPAPINFKTHAALLISMGQQRTGGYSVRLASDQIQVSDGRGKVSVKWITAKSGMVTIQMLTNPCLLLKVPRGNYRIVDVVDQNGNLQQTIAIQSK